MFVGYLLLNDECKDIYKTTFDERKVSDEIDYCRRMLERCLKAEYNLSETEEIEKSYMKRLVDYWERRLRLAEELLSKDWDY